MRILAIETSCDETSAAVVEYRRGRFRVLSNIVSSQIKIHKKFGGVVPEVAARKQVELIIPVISKSLTTAARKLHANYHKLITKLDVLAVTAGPGLMIALSVGVETARTLTAVWKKPIVAVNHLEGHLYSPLLHPYPPLSHLRFPAIALIVSGGHTELILIKDYLNYKLLGRTRDDAAGEAYDKVAKLLDLGYPGGPIIDRLAQTGNPQAFTFPRGMMNSGDYDFSFSGLKTAVLYKLQEINTSHRHPALDAGSRNKNKQKIDFSFDFLDSRLRGNDNQLLNNLCASFQSAVADVLVAKTVHAAQQFQAKTILLGGGVAANSQLRKQLTKKCKGEWPFAPTVLIPHLSYTTDNAAMIAAAAAFRAERKQFMPWQKLRADPNLTL